MVPVYRRYWGTIVKYITSRPVNLPRSSTLLFDSASPPPLLEFRASSFRKHVFVTSGATSRGARFDRRPKFAKALSKGQIHGQRRIRPLLRTERLGHGASPGRENRAQVAARQTAFQRENVSGNRHPQDAQTQSRRAILQVLCSDPDVLISIFNLHDFCGVEIDL